MHDGGEDHDGYDGDDGDYMTIVCPDAVSSGDLIVVDTPDGHELEVEIPVGVNPGTEFEIYVGGEDGEMRTSHPDLPPLQQEKRASTLSYMHPKANYYVIFLPFFIFITKT